MLKKVVLVSVIVILLGTLLVPFVQGLVEEDEALDIILIEGQSNAENWLVDTSLEEIDETIGAPSKRVYYSANTVYAGDFDEVDKDYSVRVAYNNGWVVGGYIAGLGKLWTDRYHRDVLFINTGIGSSSIDKLSPGGIFWDYITTMIETALNSDVVASYPKVNKIGWLWCQGEFDTNTVADYTTYFNTLDSAMKGYGFYDCYNIQTRVANSHNSLIAMKNIIKSNPSVHLGTDISDFFTPQNGLLYSADNVHYTQKGRNLISEELIDVIPAPEQNNVEMISLFMILPIFFIVAAIFVFVRMRTND